MGLQTSPEAVAQPAWQRSTIKTLSPALKNRMNKILKERLTGQDMANLSEEKWQLRDTVNGVCELLKALRMSWVSSRSKHPQLKSAATGEV